MIRSEIPSGVIDGVNATFATVASPSYASGSLSAYLNGNKISPNDIAQTDPSAGTFTITNPRLIPRSRPGAGKSDCLSIDYDDGISTIELREVDYITCEIGDAEQVDVVICEAETIACEVEEAESIVCLVLEPESVIVTITEAETIAVQVEDC